MTREHKVALIIGFSLILLVAVLISDHVSRARRTPVDEVKPSEVLAASGRAMPGDAIAPPAEPASASPLPEPIASAADPGPPPADRILTAPVAAGVQLPSVPPSPVLDPGMQRAIADAGGSILSGPVPQVILPVKPEAPSPAASSAPPGKPEDPPRYHAVQKGETLYQIAARYYGSGSAWKQLAELNRDRVGPNGEVRAGVRLLVPVGAAVTGFRAGTPPAAAPKPSPGGPAPRPAGVRIASSRRDATYTIRAGDTLGDISQRMLGTSRRWREILDLNRLDEDDVLMPGTVLKLPGT